MKRLMAFLMVGLQFGAPLFCCCLFASAPSEAAEPSAMPACHQVQPAAPSCHGQAATADAPAVSRSCDCALKRAPAVDAVLPASDTVAKLRLTPLAIAPLPIAPAVAAQQFSTPLFNNCASPPTWLMPDRHRLNVYRL